MPDLLTTLPDGRTFPHYGGQALSWNIGSYFTTEEEKTGCHRIRAVVLAMRAHQPRLLENELRELNRSQFDCMFGHNARRLLAIVRKILETPLED